MPTFKDFFPASSSKTWTDPATGEQYSYPADFVNSVWRNLGLGYANRLHADALLTKMGYEASSGNMRELRTAMLILRRRFNVPVVSVRAANGGGGYFVAITQAEADSYTEAQMRLAMSMFRGVMSACWRIVPDPQAPLVGIRSAEVGVASFPILADASLANS
jgi:hypothetical protein